MNREDVIRKIKRCLALSQSAEPHEAAAAMRQAQKLTEQLGLTEVDLQLADVQEARVRINARQVQAWEGRLASMVADAMGCELYLSSGWSKAEFCLAGVAPAHELAAYALEVLHRQCTAMRLVYVRKQPKNCKPATKRARGDAFAMAWVQGVRALVQRIARNDRHQALLQTYMERTHPTLGEAKLGRRDVGRNVRSSDFDAGRAAAGAARLHDGVGKAAGPRLIANG